MAGKWVHDTYASEKNTCPRAELQSGTITSGGSLVTGSGTAFTDDMVGGWIWNGDDEVRQIDNVTGDTTLALKTPFTADLSGADFYFIPRKQLRQLSYVVVTGTASIDGRSRTAGVSDSAGIEDYSSPAVDPIIVDALAATVNTSYLK